jgi:hypothetical protein
VHMKILFGGCPHRSCIACLWFVEKLAARGSSKLLFAACTEPLDVAVTVDTKRGIVGICRMSGTLVLLDVDLSGIIPE